VYSGAQPDGMWGGWIVFFPVGASAARVEAGAVERARNRTDERFLATAADAATLDAEAHEAAAEVSREQANAADAALRARRRKTASKKKK
jgi:hypothetical protein